MRTILLTELALPVLQAMKKMKMGNASLKLFVTLALSFTKAAALNSQPIAYHTHQKPHARPATLATT
jgi:hypothetical protein